MRLLTYVCFIALLTGCGEISYKQGGSQQEIDRAHQACRGSGDQLSVCLAQHGWKKPQVDALDPLFATIEVTDNREATQTKPSPFIDLSAAPAAKTEAAPVAKIPHSAPIPTAEGDELSAQAKIPASQPEQRSTVNDGPDVEYSINSWWKMGAFPNQLKQDQTSCEKKLGSNYLPDYKTQTYKRAFVSCMHDLGWMAVRNIK